MKNITIIKTGLVVAASVITIASCTNDFKYFNTNQDAVQEVDQRSYITTMQLDAVIPSKDVGANEFQRACNLIGDAYAGYLSPSQQFNAGSYTCTYDLNGTDYNDVPYSVAFTNVMPAWLNLKYAFENKQITEDIFAVAEVMKVMCLQRTTDIYGPIPVSNFGKDVNPYEAQETVYMNLFKDLNAAIDVLKNYASAESGATTPLTKVDAVYAGNYAKWYKLANSQKLRMAMRVRYAIPEQAKAWAEEAVAAGVMESADDGATLKTTGSIAVMNPLNIVWNMYGDTRMGATIDSYMNGYNDPRLPKYFKQAMIDGGGYHGIRSGIADMRPNDDERYTVLSSPNVESADPVIWLLASEVAFLKAEGALLNWNMGADAETLYKQGITLSFLERGLAASQAEFYCESNKTPAAFTDNSLNNKKYNYAAPSTITPKWDNSATTEVNLERIITQKWIAMYPNGQEAWSEFRRTGYPRVIPIVDNRSNGLISTDEQVRRMTFPRKEYANNNAEVQAAIALIGGQDNGSVKLWWDKKN